jgi:hypothetical protein
MGTHRIKPSSEAAADVAGAPGLSTSAAEDDVVVQIGSAAELHGQQPAADEPLVTPEDQPFDRFRRRLERFRGLGDAEIAPGSLDDESELRLQVMLLREENARLKAARHQTAGAGSALERVRLLNAQASTADAADDAWSLLTDCLVIREGLQQVCLEMQGTISAIQQRLERLAMSFEGARPTNDLEADGAGSVTA